MTAERETLERLIADLEAVRHDISGGHPDSGRLDHEIHKAIGWEFVILGETPVWRGRGIQTPASANTVPRYTIILDAALMLVPNGYAWSIQSSQAFPGQAWLYPPNNVADIDYRADAATAALALCAAALKARLAAASPNPSEDSA